MYNWLIQADLTDKLLEVVSLLLGFSCNIYPPVHPYLVE